MEIYKYKTPELQLEREKYRQDIAILEATEGWTGLSYRQKEVIRTALYLQARAQRDMDPAHKNDPWYFDWFRKTKHVPKYKKSLEHVKRWYCHAAVASLESGSLFGVQPPNHPDSFFDASYFKIHDILELEQAINYYKYPAVVHVSTESDNIHGETYMYHSFLALGRGNDGKMVVWDKEGFSLPYRVTTLNAVFDEYTPLPYWGIRKLRG